MQLEHCIANCLTFASQIDRLTEECHEFELSLTSINIRLQNDGQTSMNTLQVVQLLSKFN
jgi:hypothetical protein